MKKAFLLAVLAITLVGCATAAQRQANQISTIRAQANNDAQKCVEANYNSPEYDSIRAHLKSPSQTAPNSEQLHDKAYPTKSESELLSSYFDNYSICTKEFNNTISTVAPTIAAILAEKDDESDKIRLLLIKRKITWGNYYQQRQQIEKNYNSKLAIASQEMQRNLIAEHQAEMRQRQAIGAAMDGMSAGMQSMGNAYSNAGNAYGNAAASPVFQQAPQPMPQPQYQPYQPSYNSEPIPSERQQWINQLSDQISSQR